MQRDVCAKCGITLEERVKWWREASGFKIGHEGGLFLWCEHCKKAICGGCVLDLGMAGGCPFCNNIIEEFGDEQVKAILAEKGVE